MVQKSDLPSWRHQREIVREGLGNSFMILYELQNYWTFCENFARFSGMESSRNTRMHPRMPNFFRPLHHRKSSVKLFPSPSRTSALPEIKKDRSEGTPEVLFEGGNREIQRVKIVIWLVMEKRTTSSQSFSSRRTQSMKIDHRTTNQSIDTN